MYAPMHLCIDACVYCMCVLCASGAFQNSFGVASPNTACARCFPTWHGPLRLRRTLNTFCCGTGCGPKPSFSRNAAVKHHASNDKKESGFYD